MRGKYRRQEKQHPHRHRRLTLHTVSLPLAPWLSLSPWPSLSPWLFLSLALSLSLAVSLTLASASMTTSSKKCVRWKLIAEPLGNFVKRWMLRRDTYTYTYTYACSNKGGRRGGEVRTDHGTLTGATDTANVIRGASFYGDKKGSDRSPATHA